MTELAGRPETAAFLSAIESRLPRLELSTAPDVLDANRRDETAYLVPPRPLAVAFPTTTAEVAELVRLAAAHGVPVVPRGAGSGLSGGSVAVEGGLTISLMRMDRILDIDRGDLVAVTQPGVINARLKAAVADEGLFYAPDPASYERCTIGGNLGTNAGGLCCVKYGVTRDAVLGLEVVLADGSVIRTGGRTVKDVAGNDLTGLIVGSQGTLGIVTEAALRLRPAPAPMLSLTAYFADVAAAGAAVAAISGAGVTPCTVELMDAVTIAAVDDWLNLGLDRRAAALLLVESDLPGEAAVNELNRAAAACLSAGATGIARSADSAEADELRKARREAYHALERIGVARMEDTGVPRSRVPQLLAAIEGIGARHEILIGTFGHAGDGNLHPTFVFDPSDESAPRRLDAARADLYAATIALGGTVTGEHGIGTSRRAWLEPQRGARAVEAMRAIKQALDPLGTLNPGKMLA